MMRICIITTVLWLSLAVRSSRSAVHPPSPCPDIFAYEGTEPENNRWYGEISLKTDESLVGIRLDIELDRPSDLMVSWMGETSSNDNVKYTILNLNQKLRPGPPVLSRIMVKFNRSTGSPRLRVIRLNGRKICPEDTHYNSDYDVTTKPQRPQNTKRPDPEFGESANEQIDEFPPNYNNNNNNQNSNANNNKEYSSGGTGSNSDKRPVYNNNNNNNKETSYKPPQSSYGIDQPSNNYNNNDNDNRPVYNNNKVTMTTTLKPTIRPPFDSGNSLNNKPNTVSLQASTDSNNKDQISGVIDEILSNPSNNKTVIITVINNNDNTQEQNSNNNRPSLNNNRPDTNQNRPTTNQNRPEVNSNRPSSSSSVGGSNSRPVATETGTGQSRPQNSNSNINNNNRPSEQQTSSSNQKPNKNQNQDSSYSTTNSQQVIGSTCGEVKLAVPLVTNGQSTHRGQWPWHVALYLIEGINLSYNCGGSLVSRNKVITAAHCVTSKQNDAVYNSSKIVVYLGKYHQLQYSDELGVQTKQVTRINVFPSYNSSNYLGDIAVLTLSSEVELTNYVTPVCMWDEKSNELDDIVGKEGTVVGWGYDENDSPTEELKMAKMPVVSHQTCLWSYPQFYSEFTSDKTFCAGFRNGTSVCNGDSGGGMVFSKNNRWFLRGIVSITVAKEGLRVCDTKHYVVFTDVSKYLDFIKKNMR